MIVLLIVALGLLAAGFYMGVSAARGTHLDPVSRAIGYATGLALIVVAAVVVVLAVTR